MFFLESEDYERIGFRQWRVLKSFDTVCEFRPPEGKEVRTKFALFNSMGILTIEKGFRWDGATFALDTDDIMKGSCVHDWFCNAVNKNILPAPYRRKGDDLFELICLDEGMPEWRAGYVHAAVVAWGKAKHG